MKPMMDQEEMEIKPSWDVPQNSYFNASPLSLKYTKVRITT